MKNIIPLETVAKKILIMRGHKVMLNRDLAGLYMVEPKVLNRAVKRNMDRFPEDFMFQLSPGEWENLKCQIGASSWGGDRRALPYAFTEQGVAMLSSVLRSKKAVYVNIQVMRAFVGLRSLLASHKDLAHKLEELEKKYNAQFKNVFDAIKMLMAPAPEADSGPKTIPGFKPGK